MRVPDEVRQCVVFIALGTGAPQGGVVKINHIGTGFFVSIPSEVLPRKYHVYLVTARHVISATQGRDTWIRANTLEGSSLGYHVGAHWWYHPTDPSVDVAVIPWAPPSPPVAYKHIPVDMFLTDEHIRNLEIGVGDEVFMTGLFSHVTGSKRNLPIVRMGNIAMIPNEVVPTSVGLIEAYLVEARSIGGLSGSPVFVRQSVVLGESRVFLLGLMRGHWDLPPESKNDQVDAGHDVTGAVNMGIAIVVPAKKILEVLHRPELVDIRRKYDEEQRNKKMPTLDEAEKPTPAA